MSLIRKFWHEVDIRIGPKRIRCNNLEGDEDYRIRMPMKRNLPKGISAVMRVKNEEVYLEAAIQSALRLADEVVCVDNGSTDNTLSIAQSLAKEDSRVSVFQYPFDCFDSGPEHSSHPSNSVRSRSYFYNWCMAKANFSHVWKWDGDQILAAAICLEQKKVILSNDITHGCGIDLYSISPMVATKEPFTSNEPHFFRNSRGFHYFMGTPCEFFSYPRINAFRKCRITNLKEPYFFHLKYSRRDALGKGWVADWKEQAYFNHLVNERKSKGEPINTTIPMEFDLLSN